MVRQKILLGMVTDIPWAQSALNFFMYAIYICYYNFQISKPYHIFKWFFACLYFVILSCILFTRDEHSVIIQYSSEHLFLNHSP